MVNHGHRHGIVKSTTNAPNAVARFNLQMFLNMRRTEMVKANKITSIECKKLPDLTDITIVGEDEEGKIKRNKRKKSKGQSCLLYHGKQL